MRVLTNMYDYMLLSLNIKFMFLNNMNMTESSFVSGGDSRLGFLSPPHNNFFNTQNVSPHQIADEIFLQSLNSSYIGRMSGYKQPIETVDLNILDVIPEDVPEINSFHKKRIDFSRYKISP